MNDDTKNKRIADIAAAITGSHMEALDALTGQDIGWEDLAFASMISLKAVAAIMNPDDDDHGVSKLRAVIDMAMAKEVVGKKFVDEAEAQAWMDEQGLDPAAFETASSETKH